MVFFSSSFAPPNNAFAADMPGGSMDGGDSGGGDNQGGDSGDGDKDNKGDDSSDGMPKDAPLTSGALTAGGDSDNDDDNDDSEGDEDNDNDNDNEPTSKDSPQTADTITANKPECPAGQEYYLFSASCKPVGAGNSATSAANVCPTSYSNPEESDQSSVWGMKNEQLMKINRGVFYYTVDDKGIQQEELSLFHQMQGMQLGKTYDLSSYSGTECNINQVRNEDGSITATITYPNSVKQVIRTDTTGKVPIQITYLDDNGIMYSSEAIDNVGIATAVSRNVGYDDEPGVLKGIETREPDGRPIISVVLDSKDGSVKILDRTIGVSGVARYELQDDNDGDPKVATAKNGMKVTVTPFNVAEFPGASIVDPLKISAFRVTNPDSSVKTDMIINPDGTLQPGSKWTTEAPVEPANE
jgi:hypothetical protein